VKDFFFKECKIKNIDPTQQIEYPKKKKTNWWTGQDGAIGYRIE
jgi:hypothetical protein